MRVRDWYVANLDTTYLDLEFLVYTGDRDTQPVVGAEHNYEYGDWNDSATDANPTFLRVPYTTWGDAIGNLIDRSNYECFIRDYPHAFVKCVERDDTRSLLLPWHGEIDPALGDAIARLGGYCIYDDDHHSNLRHQLVTENFNAHQFTGDYVYTINGLLHDDGDYNDTVRNDFKVTDDWLRDQFWTFVHNLDNDDWIIEENPTYVYVSIDTIELAAKSVVDTLIADWNAKVTWLKDRTEGLF